MTKPLHYRKWGQHLAVAATIGIVIFLFRPALPPTGVSVPLSTETTEVIPVRAVELQLSQRSQQIHDQGQDERTAALEKAISEWKFGPAPEEVLIAAGACTPRDATDAILRSGIDGGVVDVGANKGWPVTHLALKHGAEWILSVEPDERNYGQLKKLGDVKAIQGAVSAQSGWMEMAFHKDRDDFTCFDCLNKNREEVEVKKVRIFTVDELIGEKKVGLLKTDTQGHEAEVIKGAPNALRGVDSVIMEFDPKLLRKFENAQQAVGGLLDGGMRCVGLTFAGGNGRFEWFGKEIAMTNLKEFWDFVTKVDMYTDLLCLRR